MQGQSQNGRTIEPTGEPGNGPTPGEAFEFQTLADGVATDDVNAAVDGPETIGTNLMLQDQGSVDAQQSSKLLEDARTEAEPLAATNLRFRPHAHEEVVSLLAEVIGQPGASSAGSKQADSVQNAGTSATGTIEQASAQSDNAQNIEIPAEALPAVLEAVSQLSTVYAYDTQSPTRTEPSQTIQRRLQNSRTVMYLRSRLEEQRLVANDTVSQFMADVPTRVQSLVALGERILARIQPTADAAKRHVVAVLDAEVASLTTHFAQVRGETRGDAHTVRTQIRQQYEATKHSIHTATDAARNKTERAYNHAKAKLKDEEKALRTEMQNTTVWFGSTARGSGDKVGQEAVAIGNKKAEEYETHLDSSEEMSLFDDGAASAVKSANTPWLIRADVARKVAKMWSADIIREAGRIAYQADGKEPPDSTSQGTREPYYKLPDTFTIEDCFPKKSDKSGPQPEEQLTSHYENTRNGLVDAEEQSLLQASETMTSLLESVDQALQATLQALEQQDATQFRWLYDVSKQETTAIDQTAQSAMASLQQGIGQVALGLVASLNAFPASMEGRPAPDLEPLRKALAGVLGQIDEGMIIVQGQLEEGIASTEQMIEQQAQQATTDLVARSQQAVEDVTAVGTDLHTTLTALSARAVATFVQLHEGHGTMVGHITTTSETGFQDMIGQIAAGFAAENTKLQNCLTHKGEELERLLRGSLPALNAKIDAEAQNAVQKHLNDQWKILLLLPVMFIGAGVAALGAAIGASMGAVAAVVGAIVGGAIGGALGGFLNQLGSNLIDGKDALADVGKAMAIEAIAGLFGGLGGVLGNVLAKSAKLATGLGRMLRKGASVVGEIGFDIAGNIAGKKAVGDELTLEGVLMDTWFSRAVSMGASGLGPLRRGLRAETATPGARAQADAPTTQRPDGQTRVGPLFEGTTLVGARSKATPELTVKVGDTGHVIEPRPFQGRVRLFMCSECGPIRDKIEQTLKNLDTTHHDDPQHKTELEKLLAEAKDLEAQIAETLPHKQRKEQIERFSKRVNKLLLENRAFQTPDRDPMDRDIPKTGGRQQGYPDNKRNRKNNKHDRKNRALLKREGVIHDFDERVIPVAKKDEAAPKEDEPVKAASEQEIAEEFFDALNREGLTPFLSGGAAIAFQGGRRPIADLDFRVSAKEAGFNNFNDPKGRAMLAYLNQVVLATYRQKHKKQPPDNSRRGAVADQFHTIGEDALTIGTSNWYGVEVSLSVVPWPPRSVLKLTGNEQTPSITALSLDELLADKLKTMISRTKKGEESVKKVSQDVFDFLDVIRILNEQKGGPSKPVSNHLEAAIASRLREYAVANLEGIQLHHLSTKELKELMRARAVLTAQAHIKGGPRQQAFQKLDHDWGRKEIGILLNKLGSTSIKPQSKTALRQWMATWNERPFFGPARKGKPRGSMPKSAPSMSSEQGVDRLLALWPEGFLESRIPSGISNEGRQVLQVLYLSGGFRRLVNSKKHLETLEAFGLTKYRFSEAYTELSRKGLVFPEERAGLHLILDSLPPRELRESWDRMSPAAKERVWKMVLQSPERFPNICQILDSLPMSPAAKERVRKMVLQSPERFPNIYKLFHR
jgi:hypothetical protein